MSFSGSENWNDPLSIHELLSPVAKLLLKYQPDNLALLVDEKTITDEVLNKNSDFYALFLELKRAKTPMAMQEAILKYKEVLNKPEHHELLKTSIAIVEMLYKRFNEDAGASDIRFASLEEAVKMIDSTAIDWKKNTQEYFLNEFKKKERLDAKREDALAMLQEGLSPEMIGRVTKLPLAEIEKLQTQRV